MSNNHRARLNSTLLTAMLLVALAAIVLYLYDARVAAKFVSHIAEPHPAAQELIEKNQAKIIEIVDQKFIDISSRHGAFVVSMEVLCEIIEEAGGPPAAESRARILDEIERHSEFPVVREGDQ